MMKFRKLTGYSLLILLIIISVFGLRPFQETIDAEEALAKQTGTYVTEIQRLPDASYLVAVRTTMPEVTADMLRWWFADFMQTTEHYQWWHPEDHVWMEWENKEPGKIIDASHLVHEYIGGELSKLRIQFVNPFEFFGYDPNDEATFVICARVGLLEEEMNIAKMCHVARNTLNGAEMRSRFWLGHVAKREGNSTIYSLKSFIGNMFLIRLLLVNKQSAKDLGRHAEEEMKYLAALLPVLYGSKGL